MKENASLLWSTKVIVTNKSLKTFGKVFTVCSFTHDNYFNSFVAVQGHGLSFKIKKSNIEVYKEEEAPVATPLPEPEIEPVPLEYRVANSANQILKEIFYTLEDAQAAIRKWAGGLNQQIDFQILTVVKSYKANREIVLEELK